jgi:hypothetical protein
MIGKKSVVKITRTAEQAVYNSASEISNLIKLHAMIGMFEMEVFVTKEIAKRTSLSLQKRGFYTRITNFNSLENDCRLYVSWISSS